jgi:hypothetical protein
MWSSELDQFSFECPFVKSQRKWARANQDCAIPGKNVIRITTLREGTQTEDGKAIPGSPETVPREYNKLEFTVEPGKKNIADFNLTSQKESVPPSRVSQSRTARFFRRHATAPSLFSLAGECSVIAISSSRLARFAKRPNVNSM